MCGNLYSTMLSLLMFQEPVDLDSSYAPVQPWEVRGSLLMPHSCSWGGKVLTDVWTKLRCTSAKHVQNIISETLKVRQNFGGIFHANRKSCILEAKDFHCPNPGSPNYFFQSFYYQYSYFYHGLAKLDIPVSELMQQCFTLNN